MFDAADPRRLSPAEIASQTLRDFIATSPAAFIMLDHDLFQIEASPRWRADFGGIATSLVDGQHFYDSYPNLPRHLRAAHRKGLAGEVTREPHDRFKVRGREVCCSWEVRPWGDIPGETGGIIVYAEHLNETQAVAAESGKSRVAAGAKHPREQIHALLSPSSLIARAAAWAREGCHTMQDLLSGYREMGCTCGEEPSYERGHEPDCPAHVTVPLVVQAEQAIRRLCMLEELLRKDWTLIN
jgi:hypothetical protein